MSRGPDTNGNTPREQRPTRNQRRGFGSSPVPTLFPDGAEPHDFTEAELSALMLMIDTEGSRRSAAYIGLDRWEQPDELRLAGFQSLVRSGLVTISDGEYVAQGVANAIALTAAVATRWEFVAVASLAEPSLSALYVVQAPGGGLLIELRGDGVHRVTPLRSGLQAFAVGRALLARLTPQSDGARPFLITVEARDGSHESSIEGTTTGPETIRVGKTEMPVAEFWEAAA